MNAESVAECLRMVIEGDDIPPVNSLLSRITVQAASEQLEGFPYSIITNVEHADFWQRVWLARVQGEKIPSLTEDWRVPGSSEWPQIRRSFIDNLNKAHQLASADPFQHSAKTEQDALKALMNIAVHSSYHIGQIKLMRRVQSKRR